MRHLRFGTTQGFESLKPPKVSKQPDHVGLFAADMALIRLRATFRSALFLIMQGFAFEAEALCRIVLEQYGFAYTASKSNDADFIQNINVTKTISNLKKVLPYAGKLYGELSSQSHLDPKNNRHYIEDEDNVIIIRYRLPQSAKIIALYSMFLAEDMGTIIETIFGDEFRTVDPDDQAKSEDYLDFIKNQRNELETELNESEK
jgi:hypothetical protein